MMTRVCALMRGINVNGIAIKMAELKAAFAEMGYPDAKTLLATGNVVFSIPDGASLEETKSKLEQGLSERFGYEAHLFLRGEKEIEEAIQQADAVEVPKEYHLYWFLCEEEGLPGELLQKYQEMPSSLEGERFWIEGDSAYWIVPKGSTLSSDFGSKVLGAKRYRDKLTSRNLNTVRKISEALKGK
ncbi:DUF1697 domain-containing protein [Gorillibacterium sp. CAU 1737]|uniref:DUF1697 domain-containing protein n=1 Tax=Gorillibacterium sp. CAU 1737 TaxID=3140362 RepID=UPI0032613264